MRDERVIGVFDQNPNRGPFWFGCHWSEDLREVDDPRDPSQIEGLKVLILGTVRGRILNQSAAAVVAWLRSRHRHKVEGKPAFCPKLIVVSGGDHPNEILPGEGRDTFFFNSGLGLEPIVIMAEILAQTP